MALYEFACRRCGGTWEAERKRGQTPYYCAPCRPLAIRERDRKNDVLYRERNREKLSNRKKMAYAGDPRRFKGYNLRAHYGIGIDEYEALLERQGGGCALCGATECQTGRAMPVDHDHACCSGKRACGNCVRGVLCHSCNAGLLPGYEALPDHLRDSAHINAYLAGVIERDPLLIGLD